MLPAASSPLRRVRRASVAILSVLAVLATGLMAAAPAQAVPGAGSSVFINEIHYDNASTDTGEAVEIAAPAGTDLSAWKVVGYSGNTPTAATTYSEKTSLGTAPDSGNGWGFVLVAFAGLQNGGNDGVALVDGSGSVVQLLSYEGLFTASNGPAAGNGSTDIGVSEVGTETAGGSLQLTGGPGDDPADFTWVKSDNDSFGQINSDQTFVPVGPPPDDTAPAVASATPADGATGVDRNANVTVTFNETVNATESAFAMICSNSGVQTLTITGDSPTYTLDPAGTLASLDTCSVTVARTAVTDRDVVDPPDEMAADFTTTFSTPAPAACGPEYTPAYAIQGSGSASPMSGRRVATKGVVVGDYEGPQPALRGFYLQDLQGDDNAATSDALFVFNSGSDEVQLGQVVWVVGEVSEFQAQTQIEADSVEVCDPHPVSFGPTSVTLPVADPTFLERYEGMLVQFDQQLTVTETFQLGRFGQVVMSSGGRQWQPTHLVEPGDAAKKLQAENNLNRIIVDDELQNQNRDPILFGGGGDPLTASNTLRIGDTADDVLGVMTYTWGGNGASPNAYRLRPVNALGGGVPDFEASNVRPAEPADVGGSLKVASFNVLNYFNTFNDSSTPGDDCRFGVGGGPSDCRGADNPVEFERQAAKVVNAILGLDADVVGLIEIENDGYGPDSAIQNLTDRLNATASGDDRYAVLDVDHRTGQVNAAGTDAIKVGFIYRPDAVRPVGRTATLNTGAFGDFRVQTSRGVQTIGRSRPAVSQAFVERGNGGRAVVTVNHLKSKGSSCANNILPVGPDPDTGDGQANCNLTRTAAAEELVEWLATRPTRINEDDSLIIGDLNAYAKEDPVDAIKKGGYTDLLQAYHGSDAYSYVFDGQSGYLDHALASETLRNQVTGVTEWHINADEPTALDYNTNFKSVGHVASLYAPDPFRSSDHDAVLIGLDLVPQG